MANLEFIPVTLEEKNPVLEAMRLTEETYEMLLELDSILKCIEGPDYAPGHQPLWAFPISRMVGRALEKSDYAYVAVLRIPGAMPESTA